MYAADMKILCVGAGPLPSENEGVVNAGGLRTAQFLAEIQWRYDMSLFVVENKEYNGIKTKKEETKGKKIFRHVAISKSSSNLKKSLRKEIKRFSPDIIIGMNTFPSFLTATCIPKSIPFWADINGWGMSEMQAQAASMGSNAFLSRGQEMETTILKRADRISVVSTPQKYATYGELALMGRLSKENLGYPFVTVIENSCLPLREYEKKQTKKIFRGKEFPKEAFVLLWIGGFNAWADEETLFYALEKAMSKNKNIHFVCTGKELKGIDETRFPHFQKLVEKSRFQKRFHLLGWLSSKELPFLFHECDAGINVDIACAETEFGARNRLNEFLRFKLPIITTQGAEISNILGEEKAALTCANGDVERLSQHVLALAASKAEQKHIKKRGEALRKGRFSATITQSSVQQWIQNPSQAPDRGKLVCFTQKTGILSAAITYYKQRGAHAFWKKILQKIR